MHQPARSPLSRWTHRHWLLASLLAFSAALVVTIIPGLANATRGTQATHDFTTIELPLPAATELFAGEAPAAEHWLPVTIESGQTLGGVFAELGLPASLMYQALEVPGMREPLVRLRAGAVLEFQLGGEDGLQALRFERDEAAKVELRREDGKFVAHVIERPLERRVMTATGEITSSLYAAGQQAGLSDAVINQMANAFSYDIDFTQDLRTGDSFKVIYEEIWREGERLRSGGVVAASFTNRGKEFTAVRWERNGKAEYFDLEGRPLKKSFMRMPIEFARISSRFNPNRKHPVLGTTRAHRGVDYAAATGTPIMAAGDGRVSFTGWQNGYGRTVIIDHGNGTTTLYGHMSRLGKYKVGQRVQQGAIIGYVGSTGLATGPHLHYEFRVKGVHRDPLTVTFPKPEPLNGSEMVAFRAATAPAVARLQQLGGKQLASR